MKKLSERLAWLAGILDGEGALQFRVGSWGGTSRAFLTRVILCNTSVSMIDEATAILDVLGVGYFVRRNVITNKKNPRCKPASWLEIKSKDNVEPLLRAVQPWLVTKRPHSIAMLRAIERRREISLGIGNKTTVPIDSDPVLLECIAEMKKLNRRGVVCSEPAPDQFAQVDTRQESTLSAVVGGQGEHNIPTGQPEPTLSGVQ